MTRIPAGKIEYHSLPAFYLKGILFGARPSPKTFLWTCGSDRVFRLQQKAENPRRNGIFRSRTDALRDR